MASPLRRLVTEPHPSLISLLEDLLKEAKSGEIQAVLVGGVRRDGSTVVGWGGKHRAATMIGAIEQAKWDFMRACED